MGSDLKTAAVLRLTFTANSQLDPNFRDYLRKMKSVKITPNTWDIPFQKEADKEYILNEIREDFGYPVTIMEVLENPEITSDGRRYDSYTLACVSSIKLCEKIEYETEPARLYLASRLHDLAAAIEIKSKKANVGLLRTAAQNLKVAHRYVIATDKDMKVNGDTFGVKTEIGTCYAAVNPKTGTKTVVEVEKRKLGKLLVRDIKTGAAWNMSETELIPTQEEEPFSYGAFNDDDTIIVTLRPTGLKRLMDILQGVGSEKEDVGQFITVPTKNEIVEPDSITDFQPVEDNPQIFVPSDVAENPQADLGGLRGGNEEGPLETQILQNWRTTP